MPIITTGSPIGYGLSQAGQQVGEYVDWQSRQKDIALRRRAIEQEMSQRDAAFKHQQGEWDADKQLGDLLSGVLAEDGPAPMRNASQPVQNPGPTTGSDAFFSGGKAIGTPEQQKAQETAQYHQWQQDERDHLLGKFRTFAQQAAPLLGQASPSMRQQAIGAMLNGAKRELDLQDQQHAMESAQYMLAHGAFGDANGPFAQHAMGLIAGMIQAGDLEGASQAADHAGRTVSARLWEEQNRARKLSENQAVLQAQQQVNAQAGGDKELREAGMALIRYQAGGSEAEFDRVFPHYLRGEAETIDGKWMPQEAAVHHNNLVMENESLKNELSRAQAEQYRASAANKLQPKQTTTLQLRSQAIKNIGPRPPLDKEEDIQAWESAVQAEMQRLGGSPEGASGQGAQMPGELPDPEGLLPVEAQLDNKAAAPEALAAHVQQLVTFDGSESETERKWRISHAAMLFKRWGIGDWIKSQQTDSEAKEQPKPETRLQRKETRLDYR